MFQFCLSKISYAIVSPCRALRNYTLLGIQLRFKKSWFSFRNNVCKFFSVIFNDCGLAKTRLIREVLPGFLAFLFLNWPNTAGEITLNYAIK